MPSPKLSPHKEEEKQKSGDENQGRVENEISEVRHDDEMPHDGERLVGEKSTVNVEDDMSRKAVGKETSAEVMPFTTAETMALLDAYRKYMDVLGNSSSAVSKQKVWSRIVKAVNSIVSGEKNRTLTEVKKKWKELVRQAREDFRKFKNASDENDEYPEIGIYSETIWDIFGSDLDLSADDSDFDIHSASSPDETVSAEKLENDDHGLEQSEDGFDVLHPRKRFRTLKPADFNRRSDPQFLTAPAELDSEDDLEELLDGDNTEAADVRLQLMKSELHKNEREKNKLITEIEKLDAEKGRLLLKRQKMELEIVALREKLNKE